MSCLLWTASSEALADTHQYDSLNRLTQTTRNDGSVIQYLYDAAGNLTYQQTTRPPGQSNTPPVANSQSIGVSVSAGLPFSLTGSDADGDSLIFSITQQPEHGAVSGSGPQDLYIPDSGYVGVDSFKFRVFDGTDASPEATVTIAVLDTNQPPAATAQSVSTAKDTALGILLSGTDPDNNPLSFSIVSSPANGTLGGISQEYIYYPARGFTGNDSFTFTVSDGLSTSAPATISIAVTGSGPSATPQSVSTLEDTGLAIALSGTHPTNATLSFAVTVPPSNGALSGTPPNVTYTPSLHYNGADAFEFTVSDATTTSAPATVSIDVTPVNDVPVAFNGAAVTTVNTPVAITLDGEDVETTTLTYAISTGPASGALSGTAPNVIYTPTPGFQGSDAFTFTVSDGTASSTAATVTIDVLEAAAQLGGFGDTSRASISSAEVQANGGSAAPAVSSDGRYVAFESSATNLVPADSNNQLDVFVRDLQNGTTARSSVDSSAVQGNTDTGQTHVSANGRYVGFASAASNLVAGDGNGVADIFVRDRSTGSTSRISVATGGTEANGASDAPYVSSDGRFVVFHSAASNLVADDTNGRMDVFVRDVQTGTTTRVNLRTGGTQATGGDSTHAVLSADGRYVAFQSGATNLVTGDSNAVEDVFVHDRQLATTARVSLRATTTQANGASTAAAVSTDGRYVAFTSTADNLVTNDTNGVDDVFVRDRQTSVTRRISLGAGGQEGNASSSEASLSSDGRYVSFTSSADNLVSNDTNTRADVFVHDQQTTRTSRVSVDSRGQASNEASQTSAISANGRYITFQSTATNLVTDDTNTQADIFVRDRWPHTALLPTGLATGDRAGYAVAVDGDTTVVGSRLDDHSGYSNVGSATVYARNPTTGVWTQSKTLIGTMDLLSDEDKFGHGVAVSGDVIAVSAETDDDASFRAGRVYLFGRNTGGANNWGLIKSLTGSDTGDRHYFGRTIALSGDRLVVGAHQSGVAGAAYVFERDQGGANNWGEVQKLVASDAASGDRFGSAVSIDGDWIGVGAFRKATTAGAAAGAAYVYKRSGGTWSQVKRLTAAAAVANDQFGFAVAVHGELVAVGVRFADSAAGNQTGSVILYGRDAGGTENFGEVRTLLASDRKAGDRFGSSVALSGSGVLVGSPLQDDFGTDAGKAYVFDVSGTELDQLANEQVSLLDEFGVVVAMAGSTCIVGSWLDNRPGNNSGAAYVFEAR